MIEIIPDLPENIVAAVASGKVTEMNEKLLFPAIEDCPLDPIICSLDPVIEPKDTFKGRMIRNRELLGT